MNKCLIVILLLAVLALGICGAAMAALTTTWPQSFSLGSGQTANYTFEVSYQGQIVADLDWQASGLTVLLKDPAGNIVNLPPTVLQSPVKLTYTVTAADLPKGKVWTLTFYPPPTPAPSQKPLAVGTVSVKVPNGLLTLPGGLRVLPGTPLLQSITPNYGSPMETIAIKGKSISLDKSQAEVWFELAANTPTQGTIISAAISQDGVIYQVRVPGNDNLYNSHQAPVYVKVKATGAVTNGIPFTFEPCPRGVITSHSPQYGTPGVKTTFTGMHFKSNDQVYFVIPGQGNERSPSVDYRSSTEFAAALPNNYPKDRRSITVFVRSQCKTKWFDGPQYSYPLDPAYMNSKP